MALRCFFKNLLMLCPILIGPLLHQGFHTKDGLVFPLAQWTQIRQAHSFRPVRPCLLFLSSSSHFIESSITNETDKVVVEFVSHKSQNFVKFLFLLDLGLQTCSCLDLGCPCHQGWTQDFKLGGFGGYGVWRGLGGGGEVKKKAYYIHNIFTAIPKWLSLFLI